MTRFQYTPDPEIKIHNLGAIRTICASFLSHEHGLPEWIKNSAWAYLREERPPNERVILLFFCQGRASQPASIACLDFVGMTSEQIEEDFRHWADPESSTRRSRTTGSARELGGHGNGGKCYMTQMFEDYAFLYTVRDKLGCKYGVAGGRVDFGYVSDIKSGKNFEAIDVPYHIERCLSLVRTRISDLPEPAKQLALSSKGFTFVLGVKPLGCARRIRVDTLIENLVGHPQMVTSLKSCAIYVLDDGHALYDARPLTLEDIEPREGYEEPRLIPIPEEMKDPKSKDEVSTTDRGRFPTGHLEIRTSSKNMRMYWGASRRQARHLLTFQTESSGFIGYVPMTQLDVRSSFLDYMYCDCYLDALDKYQRNERAALADSRLTRALETWISEQVKRYCQEFEDRQRRIRSQQGKNEVSKMNEFLDEWKNDFLKDLMRGLYGDGSGKGGAGVGGSQPLPSGKPVRMELTLTHPRAGVGVAFRPTLKFFDKNNKRIRPVPFRWASDDNNVAMVTDENIMLIETFTEGTTKIFAETLDGKLLSNKVPLEVVSIREVRIFPREKEMEAGTRWKFEAICKLADGTEASNVYLHWMENDPSIAKVSASGMVFAFEPGRTKITAADDRCRSDMPACITVTPGTGGELDNKKRKGFPKILLSEIDTAPGEERPAVFSPDDPPVWQRTQDTDNNIWWINMASPFARLYYEIEEGTGKPNQRWRMYHLERVVDIMVQIAIFNRPEGREDLDINTWISEASRREVEIRAAAIDSLLGFIEEGEY